MEWIKKLKVGDEVIVHSRYQNSIGTVTAVNKITVKVDKSLYYKTSGFIRNSDYWNSAYIEEATEEKVEKLKLAKQRTILALRIKKIAYYDLTREQVDKLNSILDEIEQHGTQDR